MLPDWRRIAYQGSCCLDGFPNTDQHIGQSYNGETRWERIWKVGIKENSWYCIAWERDIWRAVCQKGLEECTIGKLSIPASTSLVCEICHRSFRRMQDITRHRCELTRNQRLREELEKCTTSRLELQPPLLRSHARYATDPSAKDKISQGTNVKTKFKILEYLLRKWPTVIHSANAEYRNHLTRCPTTGSGSGSGVHVQVYVCGCRLFGYSGIWKCDVKINLLLLLIEMVETVCYAHLPEHTITTTCSAWCYCFQSHHISLKSKIVLQCHLMEAYEASK